MALRTVPSSPKDQHTNERRQASTLSLGQLQEELARVEDLCQSWRMEIAARWRLEGAGKARRFKAECAIEERTLKVLSGAQNREDLERIWQEHQRCTKAARDKEQGLREELCNAKRDAQQLSRGLPELLERRRYEARKQRQGLEGLRRKNRLCDSSVEELKQTLADLQRQANDLQEKAVSVQDLHSHHETQAEEAESQVEALKLHCSKMKQGTDELHQAHAPRMEHAQRLREQIPQLQSHVLHLENSLAQHREKLKSQVEDTQLAHDLELQTLRRSLQIHSHRLQAKQAEMSWLRHLAESLERDLARRQAQSNQSSPTEPQSPLSTKWAVFLHLSLRSLLEVFVVVVFLSLGPVARILGS